MAAISLVCIAIVLLICYCSLGKKNGHLPGPFTFPLIGNLPQLAWTGSITKFASVYRKKYGDVFTFEFGGSRRVIISGYDTIHQILIKNGEHSSTRSPQSLTNNIKEVGKDTPGLFWAPSPHWKILRTLAIITLKEEGMGTPAIEPHIHQEIEHYISHFIAPNLGKPISMANAMFKASSNIMMQLIFAKRLSYDDSDFSRVLESLEDIVKLTAKIAMAENLPFANFFMKSFLKREHHLIHSIINAKFQKLVEENLSKLDHESPQDIAGHFIEHSARFGDGKNCLSYKNTTNFCLDLFIAGGETTSTAIRWAWLYVALYPEVKKRVQMEIDQGIGMDRVATYKDRLVMPYTEAVLLETLRRSNVIPTALPHATNEDILINGVIIPAGSDILLNMASVLHDETVFEEPHKFKPERYLSGDIALKKQRTIPFGIGRRACLGKGLAKMELFLFFVSFLQRFDVRLSDGGTVTDEPMEYYMNSPMPHELIFTSRY